MDTDQHGMAGSGAHGRRVVFLLLPGVHLLDLSGPAQAFYEANTCGASYDIVFCAVEPDVRSAQGVTFGGLGAPPAPRDGDLWVVAGTESTGLDRLRVPVDLLRGAARAGATVTSVCSAAFVLGRAGLLDGRACTTHWKLLDRLAAEFPRARVLRDRLYVEDRGVLTSAGEASGIDMALALIERDHGPRLVARVAREMVVYARRAGESEQLSVFVDFRAHSHATVHRVQDLLIERPEKAATIDELAAAVAMSPRHLTRVFRRVTGLSIKEYATRIRLAMAQDLMTDTSLPLDRVAASCGFQDGRTLRRRWRAFTGSRPSDWRRNARG